MKTGKGYVCVNICISVSQSIFKYIRVTLWMYICISLYISVITANCIGGSLLSIYGYVCVVYKYISSIQSIFKYIK